MESDLSNVTSATFLKSLSVMGNFKSYIKTIVSTRNTIEGLFLNLTSRQVRLWGKRDLFFLIIVTQVQLLRTSQGQIVCH